MEIIKIDLDSSQDLNIFLERTWVIKTLGLDIKRINVYKTKHGFHVYIHVSNVLEPFKILLIQSILGDDYKHVLGALRKLEEKAENWNVLFEKKWNLDRLGEEIILSEEEIDEKLTRKLTSLLINGVQNQDEIIFAKRPV